MKLRKRVLSALLICAMVLLTGCTQLTSLTSEEKELIALYSAKVVAKHNVRLSQGVMTYKASKSDDEDEEAEEADEADEEDETMDEPEAGGDLQTDAESTEMSEKSTMTEAMGIEGIDFAYLGADVYNDLQAANSFIEEPAQGNKYIGLSFNAINDTNADIELSILTMKTKFTATLADTSADSKSMTMLLDDLSTYTGAIKAGESKELSIYFEFPEDVTKDLSSLTLKAEINEKSSQITLR